MTGPEGDQPRGWWRITAVDAPHLLEFDDGFADSNGQPTMESLVSHARVTIEQTGAGLTRMTIESTLASAEAMEQLVSMGMEEGLAAAVGQIDDLLAAVSG